MNFSIHSGSIDSSQQTANPTGIWDCARHGTHARPNGRPGARALHSTAPLEEATDRQKQGTPRPARPRALDRGSGRAPAAYKYAPSPDLSIPRLFLYSRCCRHRDSGIHSLLVALLPWRGGLVVWGSPASPSWPRPPARRSTRSAATMAGLCRPPAPSPSTPGPRRPASRSATRSVSASRSILN